MNAVQLALFNIKGNGFRSLSIFLCVMCLSGFLFLTSILIKGTETSLRAGLERLGADLLVVPTGAEARVETALLMGKPTGVWMPEEMIDRIAAVPGVDKATPQIYLQSLYGAACCSVSEMFLVVYDPETDFVIGPWLDETLGRGLETGEVFGGIYVYVPPGQNSISLYGSEVILKGNLEPTGTGLDQTIFMTLETARRLAENSVTAAEQPLKIPEGSISTVMVKVENGADPHKVALQIMLDVIGVFPIESPNLFGTYRQQINGLLWGFFVIMIVLWVMTAFLIGMIFSSAVNERRREIAVLRAVGATRLYTLKSVIVEAVLLAAGASLAGSVLAAMVTSMFQDMLAGSLRIPFLMPAFPVLTGLGSLVILLSLLTVILAASIPAIRITGLEPAMAMRE